MKKEKLEKDLKAKNLELADLIREGDRARLDLEGPPGTAKHRKLLGSYGEFGTPKAMHARKANTHFYSLLIATCRF